MAKEHSTTVNLIVPAGQETLAAPAGDRRGGQEHGVIDSVRRLLTKPVDATAFAEKLAGSISNTAGIMQQTFVERLGGYEVEQINLSLAVTAEGDIGIATAGVEASVSVSLKRKVSSARGSKTRSSRG